MAIGDVYRLKDFQTFESQQVLNVYWYRMVAGSGGAEDCAVAWALDVLGPIIAIQDSKVTHTLTEVVNMASDTDWHEQTYTSGNVGALNGPHMGTFASHGFRLIRSARTTRHGYKRIAGVVEGHYDDGDVEATVLADLEAARDALGATISDTTGNEFEPVIVRLNSLGQVVATNPVQSCVFYGLTTQNTRKRGRGA